MKKYVEIGNCCDCPIHEIMSDPDPDDWFCYDNQTNVCKKMPGKGNGYFRGYRVITADDRPYETRKYSDIPDWCPLNGV